MKKRISIIIPVLNEEQNINQAIQDILSQGDSEFAEIVVVDGSPFENTIKAIESEGVLRVPSPKGRGIQMNKGALVSTGQVLLFLHADTRLPENALKNILKTVANNDVAGGAFDLEIDSKTPFLRLISRAASLRSRLTRVPYGDQGIFIKADLFKKTGGFKEIPVMEDLEFMQRLKRNRWKITILKTRVKTSSRRWDKEGVLYCTLRNWVILLLYFWGVSPFRLVKLYR